jgi:hypothetical protein
MITRDKHKKEIRKDARQLFRQGGRTKQEVYELLVEKYKYAKDVADELKYIPSTNAIAKYGKWNSILLLLVILSTIVSYYIKPSIQVLIWMAPLIYIVATFRIKYYDIIIAFCSFVLITVIPATLMNFNSLRYPRSLMLTALVLNISVCYLLVRLRKVICPKPVERKEEHTNAEGEKRIRLSCEFSDIQSR